MPDKIFCRLEFGTVTDVDNTKYIARVSLETSGNQTGWLCVADNRPFIPDYDVPQRTEFEAGGGGYAAFASHKHDLIIKQWMPKIGQRVVVLRNYGGKVHTNDPEGIVLCAVHPWK